MIDLSQEDRILIVNLLGIGDTVLQLPMLSVLQSEYPSLKVDYLVRDNCTSDILSQLPVIDDIYYVRSNIADIFRVYIKIYKKYNYVFVPYMGGRLAALISLLSGSKNRVTCTDGVNDKKMWSGLYTNRISVSIDEHDINKNIKLTGLRDTKRIGEFILKYEGDGNDRVRKYLTENGVRDFILLHPGSDDVVKRWPVNNYMELIDRILTSLSYNIVLTGGPGEYELLNSIKRDSAYSNRIFIYKSLDVKDVACLASRAKLFIGNDSGLAHLAAAAGCDTLVLWSYASFMRIAPVGIKNLCLLIKSSQGCPDCHSTGNLNCNYENPDCFRYVTVNIVYELIEMVIRGWDISKQQHVERIDRIIENSRIVWIK